MNRFPLALIALSCTFAVGCTDLETTTDTTTQELEAECTGGVQFNGQWPPIKTWTGKAPTPMSTSQYFVVAPIDSNFKTFLAVQADWETGKIGWAAKISRSQRAAVIATLALEPGNIDALGGTRGPIKYPPGTDEGQWVIDRGFRSYEPWED